MNKRLLIEVSVIILLLSFTGVTYPVAESYSNSGTGIGNSEEKLTVHRLHDLLHFQGTVSGLISITVTDKNNDTVFTVLSISSDTTSFNQWVKINSTFNAEYTLNIAYFGSYDYSVELTATGGFWR